MTTSWVIDQTIPPRRRLGAFSAFTRLPGVANNRCAAVAERRWEPSTQMPFGWPLRANRDSYPSGSAPILDPSERDYAGFWLRTSENAVSTHSRNAAPSRSDRARITLCDPSHPIHRFARSRSRCLSKSQTSQGTHRSGYSHKPLSLYPALAGARSGYLFGWRPPGGFRTCRSARPCALGLVAPRTGDTCVLFLCLGIASRSLSIIEHGTRQPRPG
jgi:hypothetical protein